MEKQNRRRIVWRDLARIIAIISLVREVVNGKENAFQFFAI